MHSEVESAIDRTPISNSLFEVYKEHNQKSQMEDLVDYKFFCFHGKPMYCQVIKNRSRKETIDFFDMEWNHMEFIRLALSNKPFYNAPTLIPMPVHFHDMKEKAAILADSIPFVRVDFYEVNGNLYFGEMTFYPVSGFGVFSPDKWNYTMGDLIKIRR